jgi:hypothetical protein
MQRAFLLLLSFNMSVMLSLPKHLYRTVERVG